VRAEQTIKSELITTGRIIKAGFKNLFRNAWLSIAAIAVMVVALTIILLAIVLNVTARNAIAELSKSLKVSIYLKDDGPEETRTALESELKANPFASDVTYVSKDLARGRFTESFQNDKELLDGLTLAGADTLPASIEVGVSDLSKMPDIEAIAKKSQYQDVIESITLGKTDARKTIDRAAGAQNFITKASIIAAAIFTVVSVLIIFNTIRMAIFTRSEEIRIMKLIGATPNYIRGPFLVESSLYGVVAGLIASGIVYSTVFSLGSKVAAQAEFVKTYNFFTDPITVVALVVCAVLAGMLVGVFSSALAMERHLKLKHW
jgi:cell division transport system permease protein